VLVVLAALVGGAVYGIRQIYFLGADDGRLALYRGLPYQLPLGVNLYSEIYSSPVPVSALPGRRQGAVTDHTLRSHSDAVSLVEDLEASAAPPRAEARQTDKRSKAKGSRAGG
jgi:protein phosphatase